MRYVVQAVGVAGGPVSARIDDAREALAIAVELATKGCTDIRIVAGARVYTAEDFAVAITTDELP